MERWHVPDATALELIEFPGKVGKEGKRPRFRFTTHQQRITSYLPEIDAALASAGKDPIWLHRKIQRSPFSRRTPIEQMLAHRMDGMADVLQILNRAAMQAALAKKGR
jgi:gamma-glutamylcysteine synthetase